jgi:hypothetical protein
MTIEGVIYKIVCNITNETYYGSTTNYNHRMSAHLTRTDKQKQKAKCKSWDIINRGNFTFSIVEELICETKTDLLKRERYYIENNECVNIKIPYKTKEEINEGKKKYRLEHKEELLKIHAIYRENNRERLREMETKRYHNKKEEINKKKRESVPILCECGFYYKHSDKARHFKSLRHKKILEENNEDKAINNAEPTPTA